jgi:hypothetical protein
MIEPEATCWRISGTASLSRGNERPRAAHDFAGDNYDLALAGLFLSEPTVFAVGPSGSLA